MVPSHCFLAAIFINFTFFATNGQSAAVAAQYMLSGQQYQSTSGQHPAGHMVPSHCFFAAIFINFSFWATSSWAHGSFTLLLSCHLHELFFLCNKWTISSSSSTVHVVRAAVPVNFRATSSWAHGSFTLFLGSHLHELLLLVNKWTVSSSSSTVHVVRAAVPVNFRATSSWAHGSF